MAVPASLLCLQKHFNIDEQLGHQNITTSISGYIMVIHFIFYFLFFLFHFFKNWITTCIIMIAYTIFSKNTPKMWTDWTYRIPSFTNLGVMLVKFTGCSTTSPFLITTLFIMCRFQNIKYTSIGKAMASINNKQADFRPTSLKRNAPLASKISSRVAICRFLSRGRCQKLKQSSPTFRKLLWGKPKK